MCSMALMCCSMYVSQRKNVNRKCVTIRKLIVLMSFAYALTIICYSFSFHFTFIVMALHILHNIRCILMPACLPSYILKIIDIHLGINGYELMFWKRKEILFNEYFGFRILPFDINVYFLYLKVCKN